MDIINNIEQLTLKQAVGSQQLAVGSRQWDWGLRTVD